MYELLDQHRMLDAKCLDDFKKLTDFLDRFEVSPVLKTDTHVTMLSEYSACFVNHDCNYYLTCLTGFGEDCCLHEVKQIHEDSCQ